MTQGLPAWRTQPPRDLTSGRQRGQALVELALVVPLLAVLMMAIFQFALVLQTQVGLTNAIREAGRRVAAIETASDPSFIGWGSLQAWVQGELCGAANPPCDSGLLKQNVQAFDGSKLWPGSPAVTFCSYSVNLAGTATPQYQVNVDLRYQHPVFFGLLAYATDFADGTPNGFWDLNVNAQMRLENIDTTQTGFAPPSACP